MQAFHYEMLNLNASHETKVGTGKHSPLLKAI